MSKIFFSNNFDNVHDYSLFTFSNQCCKSYEAVVYSRQYNLWTFYYPCFYSRKSSTISKNIIVTIYQISNVILQGGVHAHDKWSWCTQYLKQGCWQQGNIHVAEINQKMHKSGFSFKTPQLHYPEIYILYVTTVLDRPITIS